MLWYFSALKRYKIQKNCIDNQTNVSPRFRIQNGMWFIMKDKVRYYLKTNFKI
uniref:Uncharacterized protein n=1 Tax=Arundo donax TaxID=35708 RepID=A0A0A9FIC2_ARUDO